MASHGLQDREPGLATDEEPDYLTQALLSGVSLLEGADTGLLGACSKALQLDLGLGIEQVNYNSVVMAVCQNAAAPFWGILADRGILKRRTILVLGAMGQGLVTVLLAFVDSMWSMVLLRAINGILLAALRPICNGIIADTTCEGKRGTIFGRVQFAWLIGMVVSVMTVTPIAAKTVMEFQGWRVAFVVSGSVAMIVAGLVAALMREQQVAHEASSGESTCRAIVQEVQNLGRFFAIPTFCVMVLAGVIGSIPWSVIMNMTLFFQLTGIDDVKAGLLSGFGPFFGAFGHLIGGLVADFLARRFQFKGRPLSPQLTVAMGVPLIYIMFQGIPPGEGSFGVYLLLLLVFGLLGSWAQSGTQFPIIAHIVPADSRSRVMAWEITLENSLATAIGPSVVGSLAKTFNYTFGSGTADAGRDIQSADALGKALAMTICIPWIVDFFAYGLLYWSYPRDVRRLEASLAASRTEKKSDAVGGGPHVVSKVITDPPTME